MSSSVTPTRRYYILKRFAARDASEQLEHTWRALQENTPGTALPVGFPAKTALEAAGYTAIEDLDDADRFELHEEAGLNRHAADAVIAAVAAFEGI